MTRVFVYEHLSGGGAADAPGELYAAGLAMRDAVAHDLLRAGVEVSVATSARAPEVPHGAQPVPAPADQAPADFLARQARAHELVWVVAPETDGALARLQRAVGPGQWLGCEAAAIAVASSKRATLARAAALGLTTPRAFAMSAETQRWIVKPDDGAGAVATRVHDTHQSALADLAERNQRDKAAVLEAWVSGEPLSLSLLCRAGQAELLSVNRQLVDVDAAGALSFEGVQIDAWPQADDRIAGLQAWAQSLARMLPGLRGYVGVDLVWHARHGPVLIEINPRVTMAYVGLSAALHRNLAAAVLAAHRAEADGVVA